MSRKTADARSRLRAPVAVLCLVQFVDVLGVTSAITAIPEMLVGVGADGSMAGPLATAYAMFFGGLLVLGARLGQKYGHRRVLLSGLAVFVVASGLGAVGFEAWQLVLARSLQGAASAVSVPAALSLLLAETPGREDRARGLALWSAAGAAAGATGFFVGGAAVDLLGWQSVFWINVPVGIGLAAGVAALVRARPAHDVRTSLDPIGAALLTTTAMAVVVGAALLEHRSGRVLGAASIALAVPLAFALRAWLRRCADPLIPLSALGQPRILLGVIGSSVNTAASSSTGVLLTLELQERQGLAAFESGLVLLAMSLSVIPGSMLASRVVRRHSRRMAIGSGLGLIALGNAVAALTLAQVPGVVVGISLIGFGLGLSSVGCTDLGTDVAEEHTSTATGLLNTGAQLGTAVGVAVLVLVAAPQTYGSLSATSIALGVAALAALVSAVALARWASAVDGGHAVPAGA